MNELRVRLQILEDAIPEQRAAGQGKQSFILYDGAEPTHTATPYASMHPSFGTPTQTATGQGVRITHSGHIDIPTKKNKIEVPAVHTPKITQICSPFTTCHNTVTPHSQGRMHTCTHRPCYNQPYPRHNTPKDNTASLTCRHTTPKEHVQTAVRNER